MVAPRRPACPGAHFAARADTFRAVRAWNDRTISHLAMAWSLLHHRHAMGPLRPHDTPDLHEHGALRARLRRLEEDNARLLDRERTRLEETRALAGIGRLLSERLEPDVVGLRIAESLRSLLAGGSAVGHPPGAGAGRGHPRARDPRAAHHHHARRARRSAHRDDRGAPPSPGAGPRPRDP